MREKSDKMRTIVGQMSDEDFINFQMELQYAAIWNAEGYTAVEHCIIAQNCTEDAQRRGLFDKSEYFKNRTREICTSPLYQLIRNEMGGRTEPQRKVEDSWCGWLRPGFRAEDSSNIKQAINTIFRRDYKDIAALVDALAKVGGKSGRMEEQSKPEETISSYNLQGVFAREGDLLDLFFEHYE